ncbi:hypothetical protein ACGH7X_36620 [Streptomyces sp. BBFR51]|uniref:hypothetical protein n=1 Tax=Streptomyces sp. BBFR51 TaxID=3372856 RepID=UPI0037DC060B
MNDSKAALAAAVAGGYLLGRTKKAKLAFAVGSYLAGRRIGLSPGQVLSQGLGDLQRMPQVRELTEQVRGELLTAGRAAVTAAANRRLTGLADTLRDRTEALTGESLRDDADDEAREEGAGDEEDREEARGPAPAPPHRPAKKTAKRPAKRAAKKTVPAKKATAPARLGGGRG